MGKKLLKDLKKNSILLGSAGLEDSKSNPPPPEAIAAAAALGVDLANHVSRPLKPKYLEDFDMVLAMEVKHWKALGRMRPDLREKFFLLPLFETDCTGNKSGYLTYNVPDPFGTNVKNFLFCYRRLTQALEKMLDAIGQGKARPA